MPAKRPINAEATQFRTGDEQVEIAKKGGIASGKSRREKKTIQSILSEFLCKDVKSNKALKELAESVGIKGSQSIKELVTVVCVLNTLKKGDVEKLQRISELLGEESETAEIEDLEEIEREVFGDG